MTDDEPITQEDLDAIEEAEKALKEGRTVSSREAFLEMELDQALLRIKDLEEQLAETREAWAEDREW